MTVVTFIKQADAHQEWVIVDDKRVAVIDSLKPAAVQLRTQAYHLDFTTLQAARLWALSHWGSKPPPEAA